MMWSRLPSSAYAKDTRWHHLAITFDDSLKDIYLYIDGEQMGSNTNCSASKCRFDNAIVHFGDDGTESNNFNGAIDEVSINNTVLTATQMGPLKSRPKHIGSRHSRGPKAGLVAR